MLDLLKSLVARAQEEPAVIAGVLAAGIVLLAGHFGILLDKPTVTSVLTPIVLGVLVRFKVTPTKKLPK